MLTFLSHVTFSGGRINRLETKKAQTYWQAALSNQMEQPWFSFLLFFLAFIETRDTRKGGKAVAASIKRGEEDRPKLN